MSRIWARRFSAAPTRRGAGTRHARRYPGLNEGMQRYGLLLNDAGGIKDDFMTTRLAGEAALYLVVNAGDEGSRFRLYRRKAERRGGL